MKFNWHISLCKISERSTGIPWLDLKTDKQQTSINLEMITRKSKLVTLECIKYAKLNISTGNV